MAMKIRQATRTTFFICCVQVLCIATSSLSSSSFSVEALSQKPPQSKRRSINQHSSRRDWFNQAGVTGVAVVTSSVYPRDVFAASGVEKEYLSELESSLSKLQSIPNLLSDKKWDEVRTVLKTPPVNKLWNLGETQNTALKLVKETGNVELFEAPSDLSYNLGMIDQLAYANNFIEFQPGNGKLKIKEPQDAIKTALKQLDSIIKESSQ